MSSAASTRTPMQVSGSSARVIFRPLSRRWLSRGTCRKYSDTSSASPCAAPKTIGEAAERIPDTPMDERCLIKTTPPGRIDFSKPSCQLLPVPHSTSKRTTTGQKTTMFSTFKARLPWYKPKAGADKTQHDIVPGSFISLPPYLSLSLSLGTIWVVGSNHS